MQQQKQYCRCSCSLCLDECYDRTFHTPVLDSQQGGVPIWWIHLCNSCISATDTVRSLSCTSSFSVFTSGRIQSKQSYLMSKLDRKREWEWVAANSSQFTSWEKVEVLYNTWWLFIFSLSNVLPVCKYHPISQEAWPCSWWEKSIKIIRLWPMDQFIKWLIVSP